MRVILCWNTCDAGDTLCFSLVDVSNYRSFLRADITLQTHTTPLHFFPSSLNAHLISGQREKMSLCVAPLLSLRVVYADILNLPSKRTHKWLRCTINHPPKPAVQVVGSSV